MIKERLHQLHTLKPAPNSPATLDELATFEALIGISFPEDVRELYLDHNGQDELDPTADVVMPYRLLSISQLIKTIQDMRSFWFPEHLDLLQEILPCWTDDNSNYVVLYISGPLKNHLAELNHDIEPVFQLAFRNLDTFYDSLTAEFAGTQYTRDYPQFDATSDPDASDVALYDYFQSQYHQEHDQRRRLYDAYYAMHLCPFSRSSELYELLTSQDADKVECDVAWILARRGWKDAIPLLSQLVPTAKHFTCLLDTLGNMPFHEAAEALIQLSTRIDHRNMIFVTFALVKHGYEIREVDSHGEHKFYDVRKPSDDLWIPLGQQL